MKTKVYLDANIYLDYFLKGTGFQSDIAFAIFQRAISCEFHIIISDILLFELEKKLSQKELKALIHWLKPKIIACELTSEDRKNARNVSIHKPDSFHIVLAKRMNAVLVSRDSEMQNYGAIPSQIL